VVGKVPAESTIGQYRVAVNQITHSAAAAERRKPGFGGVFAERAVGQYRRAVIRVTNAAAILSGSVSRNDAIDYCWAACRTFDTATEPAGSSVDNFNAVEDGVLIFAVVEIEAATLGTDSR